MEVNYLTYNKHHVGDNNSGQENWTVPQKILYMYSIWPQFGGSVEKWTGCKNDEQEVGNVVSLWDAKYRDSRKEERLVHFTIEGSIL